MKAIFTSADELNRHTDLFRDPQRTDDENTGPFIVICDDFYPDPNAIRKIALSQQYFQYKPPLAEQVGATIAADYPDPKLVWESSSLYRYLGTKVKNPQPGYRYATGEVRSLLGALIEERIVTDDDVVPRGWSGVVYLSPDAPRQHGTTIWRHRETNRCIAPRGNRYEPDTSQFELALSIENQFNRLVLFRENVLHRAGHGFGTTPATARLMQTFFFQTEPR